MPAASTSKVGFIYFDFNSGDFRPFRVVIGSAGDIERDGVPLIKSRVGDTKL
jgi:hypothetical protein